MKATKKWIKDMTDQQYLIKEAVNKDPDWTPTEQQLNDILIQLDSDSCPSMISFLFKQIQVLHNKKLHWRTVNKGLKILNWALLRGTKTMYDEILTYRNFIQQIHESYQYFNRHHEDKGHDVRTRAGQTLKYLDDKPFLASERETTALVAIRLNAVVPTLNGDTQYHKSWMGEEVKEENDKQIVNEQQTMMKPQPVVQQTTSIKPQTVIQSSTNDRKMSAWGVSSISTTPSIEVKSVKSVESEKDFFGLQDDDKPTDSVFDAFGNDKEVIEEKKVEEVVEEKKFSELDLLLGLDAPKPSVDDIFDDNKKVKNTNPFEDDDEEKEKQESLWF